MAIQRFMNVLMDDIRVVREFPLKCAEVQFSNHGHYFAAAHARFARSLAQIHSLCCMLSCVSIPADKSMCTTRTRASRSRARR